MHATVSFAEWMFNNIVLSCSCWRDPSDLAFQASQRILSSESSDALRVMRDLSQNIPMLARLVFRRLLA